MNKSDKAIKNNANQDRYDNIAVKALALYGADPCFISNTLLGPCVSLKNDS